MRGPCLPFEEPEEPSFKFNDHGMIDWQTFNAVCIYQFLVFGAVSKFFFGRGSSVAMHSAAPDCRHRRSFITAQAAESENRFVLVKALGKLRSAYPLRAFNDLLTGHFAWHEVFTLAPGALPELEDGTKEGLSACT